MPKYTDIIDTTTTRRYTIVFTPKESGGYSGQLLSKGEPIEIWGPSLSEARWKLEYIVRNYCTACLLSNQPLPEPEFMTPSMHVEDHSIPHSLPTQRLVIEHLDITIND